MVNSRYDNLEVRQIGDVWWWQKQLIKQRAVVQQWQKMAATRKAGKVAKAAAEATKAEETAVDEAAETAVDETAETAELSVRASGRVRGPISRRTSMRASE